MLCMGGGRTGQLPRNFCAPSVWHSRCRAIGVREALYLRAKDAQRLGSGNVSILLFSLSTPTSATYWHRATRKPSTTQLRHGHASPISLANINLRSSLTPISESSKGGDSKGEVWF